MQGDRRRNADWLAAARRWQSFSEQRGVVIDKIKRGETADTHERHDAATKRAAILQPIAASESAKARRAGVVDWLGTGAQERVIGKADFEPPAFLELGLAVSRAVCLISVRDRLGGVLASGTGFLVAPEIVLTNHHVITSIADAADTHITFDYRTASSGQDLPTTVFSLNPTRFFATDPARDCSFVAVGSRISGDRSIGDYPWLPLVGRTGKLEIGDPVYIIQHPEGQQMQFVLRENRLLLLPRINSLKDPDIFAHYEADTLKGSSGSPVLSRFWEVIALHHQAIPDVDAHGNVLDVNGNPYSGSDDSRVKWVGNEGIRVTALTRYLESLRAEIGGGGRELLESVLRSERPDYVELARRALQPAQGPNIVEFQGGVMPTSNRIELTIPLHLSLSLGTPVPVGTSVGVQSTPATDAEDPQKPAAQPVATPLAVAEAPLSPDLQQRKSEAFTELEASRQRTYYDRTSDERDRGAYYAQIEIGQDAGANFRALSDLLVSTHEKEPRYSPSTQLYPWVDLHRHAGKLVIKSIYSGQVFDAGEFLEEAFRIEARRESLRRNMRLNEAFGIVPEQALEDLLEANAPYNCEHVVPQSWFQKREPMRGDLHHLFACESGCNSFRGNHAYDEFAEDEAFRDKCGRREPNRFEPAAGKGPVARATLYFLLRYPGFIDLSLSRMDPGRLEELIRWHIGDSASEYEKHRNQAIFAVQGNRNPLIDHPDWVESIDWTLGLDGL